MNANQFPVINQMFNNLKADLAMSIEFYKDSLGSRYVVHGIPTRFYAIDPGNMSMLRTIFMMQPDGELSFNDVGQNIVEGKMTLADTTPEMWLEIIN